MLPCSTSAALLLALLLTAASSSFGQASAPETTVELGQTFTGRIAEITGAAEITDGDTFELRRSVGGTVMARLHGVDAPESA
jgi:endonuclease YncB( thermonuclease family)